MVSSNTCQLALIAFSVLVAAVTANAQESNIYVQCPTATDLHPGGDGIKCDHLGAGDGMVTMADDTQKPLYVFSFARLPLPERAPAFPELRLQEPEEVLRHHRGRESVGVHLVRVAGEDAVREDRGAAVDLDPAAREHLVGEHADPRVAQVEPVSGGVEGEAVAHVGAAEPARARLPLEQAIPPVERKRRGDSCQPGAQDEDVAVWWRSVHGRRYDSAPEPS